MNENNENSAVLTLFTSDSVRVSDDPVSLWWKTFCAVNGIMEELAFSDEAIQNFAEFSHILKRIHIRLISEGYTIRDGKIYKPNEILYER